MASGATPTPRAVRRQELLDGAIAAIRTDGPGASMEQIARGAGVTKPILYRHFGDRAGLVTAIGSSFTDRIMERVYAQVQAAEEGAAATELVSTVRAYLEILDEDPELYVFLMRQTTRDVSATPGLVDMVAERIAKAIRARFAVHGSTADGALTMAHGIVGMVHQVGDWWVRDRSLTLDEVTAQIVDLLWAGLSGVAAGTTAPIHAADLH